MKKKSTESSPPGKLRRVSGDFTKRPLTEAEKKELAALAAMPDSEIDLSDIPEIVNFDNFRPIKKPISVRIDADVLAWLKSSPGYQTRINGILRRAYLQSR